MNPQCYCPYRKKIVAHTPEEEVRQLMLKRMTSELGYPAQYLAVEKELKLLPHLEASSLQIPARRLDILCYAKRKQDCTLFPLLLVECKAVPLQSEMLKQVIGYNYFVKSLFIAVINNKECRFGWFDDSKKSYVFTTTFPTYQALLSQI